jgi:hypothetical protein
MGPALLAARRRREMKAPPRAWTLHRGILLRTPRRAAPRGIGRAPHRPCASRPHTPSPLPHLVRDQVLDAVLLACLLQGGLGAGLVVGHGVVFFSFPLLTTTAGANGSLRQPPSPRSTHPLCCFLFVATTRAIPRPRKRMIESHSSLFSPLLSTPATHSLKALSAPCPCPSWASTARTPRTGPAPPLSPARPRTPPSSGRGAASRSAGRGWRCRWGGR